MQYDIFKEEVRGKQKERFNLKAKTGSKGGSKSRKGLRTPFDSMSREEKKRLNGEVRSFNMNSLMSYRDFEQKDVETQKMLLTQWRNLYKNTEIMDAFFDNGEGKKFNTQSFADLVNGLGCPPKAKGGARTYGPRKSKKKTLMEAVEQAVEKEQEVKEVVQAEVVKLLSNGLHLEYNGEYNSEQLNKIFTKLQLLTDGEENKFVLSVSLSERI